MSLWVYFKQKGLLHGSHVHRSSSIQCFPAFCLHGKTRLPHTMLVLYWCHGPRLWSCKPDCLIVYFFVWREDLLRLGSTIDAQYFAGSNRPRDFKFARVVRLRYLVSLYICYVLLNVHDKNPLYGMRSQHQKFDYILWWELFMSARLTLNVNSRKYVYSVVYTFPGSNEVIYTSSDLSQ